VFFPRGVDIDRAEEKRRPLLPGLDLGDLFLYYSGFQMALNSLQSLLRGLAFRYPGSERDNLEGVKGRAFGSPLARGLYPRASTAEVDPRAKPGAPAAVDFTLGPGQVVALVGENGSGKTTLVKLLCRLYNPSAGSIQRKKVNVAIAGFLGLFCFSILALFLDSVEKRNIRLNFFSTVVKAF
jgi:hypothetical protein